MSLRWKLLKSYQDGYGYVPCVFFLFGLPGSHVRSRNTNNAFYLFFYLYQSSFRLSSMERDSKLHFIVVEVLKVVVPSKLVKRVNLALFIQRSRQRMGKA